MLLDMNYKALQIDRGAFNFAERFSLIHLGGGDWSKFKIPKRYGIVLILLSNHS